MKKTIFENKTEYEFSVADIREALLSHFKIKMGKYLYLEVDEGFLSKPPTVSMVISNEPLNLKREV